MFDTPAGVHGANADVDVAHTAPPKRPSRWSLRNWPVRRKVFAIVLVPLVLAMVFGGLRIYAAVNDARELRLAADRAEMIPAIEKYSAALEGVLIAASRGGDVAAAEKTYDTRKSELQNRLSSTDVAPDVKSGVTNLVDSGQDLLGKVTSNAIGLTERVTTYAPILLTAEDVINGSVRIGDEQIRAEAQGLSRAVGARGQMTMEQLLVEQGAELPEPELRTSMITLAGTEPSTLFDMSAVLGVGSPEAKTLQQEMVRRMAVMSDPGANLVGNMDLRQSLQATAAIANQVIKATTAKVTSAVGQQANDRRNDAIRDTALVLAAIVITLAIVLLVARSLIKPLRTLRDGALKVAHEDLEHEIARVRAGDERAPDPLPVYTTEEVGQVAHAVDELHAQALLLAGDEARLRLLVNDMFETMSRRNRTLVDQQLSLIDRLERNEDDPERLESLFKLDHLATRMRRTGANLLVLAGAPASRDQGEAVPLATAINAAVSEVEDYRRVEMGTLPDRSLVGAVAGDAVHMFAELIDNALRYSPPVSPVRVSATPTSNSGVLIEVHDDGIGMTETDLRVVNMRLGGVGEASPDNARHMGLFVVGRLAHQHGMIVRLRSVVPGEPASGTTVEIYLPPELLDHAGTPVGGVDEFAAAPQDHVVPAAPGFEDEHRELQTAASVEDTHRNGSAPAAETSGSLLPRRAPGFSGITGAAPLPASPPNGVAGDSDQQLPWWSATDEQSAQPASQTQTNTQTPMNTMAYFTSRARAESERADGEPQADEGPHTGSDLDLSDMDVLAADLAAPRPDDDDDDVIYQRMLSEWLVDPHTLAIPQDWKSVWDNGWSAAAEVENVPVEAHTDHGLPVRQPGARLVPGTAEPAGGSHPNGTAHDKAEANNGVTSNGGFTSGRAHGLHEAPERDPEAIRASMSSHFGGVRAARSHARETSRGLEDE
jgi:signal transduction histidine kinase